MTIIKDLGLLSLATRLRGLADLLMADGAEIYQSLGIEFHPRWFGAYYLLMVKGPLPITEIAVELQQSHPAAIKIVDAMTSAGIVVSMRDELDGRKRMIILTEKGKELESQLVPVWKALQEAVSEMMLEIDEDIIPVLNRFEDAFNRSPISRRCHSVFKERFRQEIQIEAFSKNHRLAFRDLNEDWLKESFTIEPGDREMLDHPEKIVENGGQIYFALYKSVAIATAAVIKRPENRFEIAKMAVHPNFRRRGVGRTLLQFVIEELKSWDVEQVVLQTSPQLRAANELYRSIGFAETSAIKSSEYNRPTRTYILNLQAN